MVKETEIILELEEEQEPEEKKISKVTKESVKITSRAYSELEKGFHMLPNDIYRGMTILGLKPNERMVYLYLVRLAHNSVLPFPSYENIMNNTGIKNRNTLSKALAELEEKNLIKRMYRGNSYGKANTYKVRYIDYSKVINSDDGE